MTFCPSRGTFRRIANGSPAAARASAFFLRQIAIRIVAHDSFRPASARTVGDRLLYGRVGRLCLRREVAIRLAFGEQAFSGRLAMLVGVVRLKNDLFVVCEAEPCKSVEDRAGRFLGRACKIGVFDAKQKLAAGLAGVKIVKKRGARRADVQIAGRADGANLTLTDIRQDSTQRRKATRQRNLATAKIQKLSKSKI